MLQYGLFCDCLSLSIMFVNLTVLLYMVAHFFSFLYNEQSRNLTQVSWWTYVHISVGYRRRTDECLTTSLLGGKAFGCSICWFLWCKYSHHDLFQATNMMSLKVVLGSHAQNLLPQAGGNQLQHYECLEPYQETVSRTELMQETY